MNVVLWIVQGVVAVGFLMAGGMKVTRPIAELSKRMSWVPSTPPPLVRLIGAAEILGAIGLILPMVTGILPWLTVAAAIGLGLVMVGATAVHIRRGEVSHVPATVVLLALAVFIIVGRLALSPAVKG